MPTKKAIRDRGKSLEREAARFEHTIRAGVAKVDENGKATRSDSRSTHTYLEDKYRAVSEMCSWLLSTAALAVKENKVPVMAFKNWTMNGFVWATLSRFWQNVPIYALKEGEAFGQGEYVGRLMILKNSKLLDSRKFYRGIVQHSNDIGIGRIVIAEYDPPMLQVKKDADTE